MAFSLPTPFRMVIAWAVVVLPIVFLLGVVIDLSVQNTRILSSMIDTQNNNRPAVVVSPAPVATESAQQVASPTPKSKKGGPSAAQVTPESGN